MGSIFKHGRVYWIKYYAQGQPIRENTRTDSHEAARRILKEREGLWGGASPSSVAWTASPTTRRATIC
jgi:hypothetical protein